MKRAAQEFSRYAESYSRHNSIQAKVAKKLVSILPKRAYDSVLDLGCGSGEVYRNLLAQHIPFAHLTAMDISEKMLEQHPSGEGVVKCRSDFNSIEDLQSLPRRRYDLLISSSALQWCSDLDSTLSQLSSLSSKSYFAIFTSGTFRSLHRYLGIKSPIYSEEILRESIGRYWDMHYESVHYALHFDSVYKMLRYIKESGTSGGERRLKYVETKRLLESYPYNYLKFEVLFASPKSKYLL